MRAILLSLTVLVFVGCGGSSINTAGSPNFYKVKYIDENNCSQIIDNQFIEICYDYKKKAATAVAYTLDGDLVNEGNIKDRPSFYVEKSLKEKDRISATDYINSGYDKGHMAPDASFDWSEESLYAVYTLANAIPQAPQVNRYSWKSLEDYAREKAVEYGSIHVVNVVKYGQRSSRMGKNRMAISKGYYKILYNPEENFEECYYYSNKLGVSMKDDVLEDHLVSCQSVTN
jgi:endonuclease G